MTMNDPHIDEVGQEAAKQRDRAIVDGIGNWTITLLYGAMIAWILGFRDANWMPTTLFVAPFLGMLVIALAVMWKERRATARRLSTLGSHRIQGDTAGRASAADLRDQR